MGPIGEPIGEPTGETGLEATIRPETGKGANQVVQELVANYLDHDEWFKREVNKGLSSLDDGKSVSHEEVRRQMERILSS